MDLSRYRRGSYNGIDLFMPLSSIQDGQKTIVDNYPLSTRTEVEFLGKGKRSFTMELVVHGSEYIEKRQRLINELNKQAYGQLIHPIDGVIKVAVADRYTETQRETELGMSTFSVPFQEVSDKKAPDQAESFIGKIEARASEILDNTYDYINNSYVVRTAQSYQSSSEQITELTNSVVSQVGLIIGEESDINNILSITDEVLSDTLGIASSAESINTAVSEMLNALSFIGTSEDKFTAYEALFTSGDDIETNDLTFTQEEIKTNTETINTAFQIQSLVYAYLETLNIDFLTLDDLKVKQEPLEEQYAKIYGLLNNKLRSELELLRAYANSYYLSLDLYDIIEVEGHGQSLNVLLYQYYGNLDFYDNIKELNSIANPAFIEGTIKILNNDRF